jgi:Fe-S oxidoreductase
MDEIEYTQTLDNCRFCVMCRQVCPVGQATKRESAYPRSVAFAVYTVERGIVPASAEAHRRLIANCTLCGACDESCITRQNLSELILTARGKAVAAGYACDGAEAVKKNIQSYGNPFGEAVVSQRFAPHGTTKDASVAFFPGCTALFQQPDICESALRVLQALKLNFTALPEIDCCGSPLKGLGFTPDFHQHGKTLVRALEGMGIKKVLTVCAGCTVTIQEHLRQQPPAGIQVIHISDYLNELARAGGVRFADQGGRKVHLHSPCRMSRTIKRTDPNIELLGRIPGVVVEGQNSEELVDKPLRIPESLCCGGCGSTRFIDPVTSAAVASFQVDRLLHGSSDCQTIVTSCATCKAQLAPPAKERNVKVIHIAELAAQAISPC